jgi:hypothetical protein
MTRDRWMAVIFILLGLLFALAPFIGTLSNQMVWLAALIFVGGGLYLFVRTFKK